MNAATSRRGDTPLRSVRPGARAAPGRARAALRRLRAATPAPSRPVALLAGALLAACQPYVQGNGVLGTEKRNVAAFDAISVTDGIQLEVTDGAADQAVTVSGDENVLPHIDTAVEQDPQRGAVLQVKSDVTVFDSVNQVKAVVSATTLKGLYADKACAVTATGVASPTFAVGASDGASLTLSGGGGATMAVTLAGGQHGGATLDARGYPVSTATVALQAAGANAQLAASVRVSGTVVEGSSLSNTGAATCDLEGPADAVHCGP